MIVQIYEIQTPDEAEKCIAAGVDHIGSVLLDQDRWRDPLLRETVAVSAGTGTKSSLIPIFDDEALLSSAVEYYRPDYIHFCETLIDPLGNPLDLKPLVHTQTRLKERFPELGIIRSIPIPQPETFPDFPLLKIAEAFEKISDLFLTDTWLPEAPVNGYIGITGETCDWDMAAHLVRHSDLPVILAGGLSPENVYDALIQAKGAGADSCTRTNRMGPDGQPIRFQKDFQKVRDFITKIRRAEAALDQEKQALKTRLGALHEELQDREKALPPHSVKPHQIMAIEALEEEISQVEEALSAFKHIHAQGETPSSPDSGYGADRTGA